VLAELTIENFAIIDRLGVRFEPGFTVLTGETGAGKSIIIDALQLALGTRASSDMVRSGASTAVVEAIFEVPENPVLTELLVDQGIEADDTLILRREVTSGGRSTARINGRAVPLAVLTAAGAVLVDIHGQSDHLAILRRDRQLDVLDRFGGLLDLRGRVAAAVRALSAVRDELRRVESGGREAAQKLDLLRFQVGEIEAAGLKPDEEEELAADRSLLASAERRAELADGTVEALTGEPAGGLDSIRGAASDLRALAGLDTSLADQAERLESIAFEIEDIALEIRRYRDAVDFDPARLNAVEERLDAITRLKRKYGVMVADVIAFGDHARQEMEQVENLDARLEELRSRVEDSETAAGVLAAELSDRRKEAAATLEREMAGALEGLGLKNTAFAVETTQDRAEEGIPANGGRFAYSSSGIDTVTFLVSFNPGEPLRPIDKVASGGETSRFLLALKSVLAGADRTPTLIFDEVDVGVGGRSGGVVGERLRDLARSHQVISITHLPQVAALAAEHLRVEKDVSDRRPGVAVRHLEKSERIAEIADMMSGTGTELARQNAAELFEAAQGRT